MSYSSTSFFPAPPAPAEPFSASHASSAAPGGTGAAQRWHAPPPHVQNAWGYGMLPPSPSGSLASHPPTSAPPVSNDASFAAAGSGLAQPPLVSNGGPSNGTPGLSPADIRLAPLSPMSGCEGSPMALRVILPSHVLEHRYPGEQDSIQFHIVFGSFLVEPQVATEPSQNPGFSSLVLTTNVPVLTDLPGTNPDNIPIRVQVRLPGSRATTLHSVGAYRMIPSSKDAAHIRTNSTSSSDLWNVGHQPLHYGPMRSHSGQRRDISWDPAHPYMRGRYPEHAPLHPGSPNRSMVPRGPQTMVVKNGMAPPLVRAPAPNHPDSVYIANTISSRPRAQLRLQGDLNSMAYDWTLDELREGRRLVQFWRKQEGAIVHATFRPIMLDQYVKNSIVVSCIFRADRDECYITSVDTILLLEALVAFRFSIEEKNRIRRNLEGFHPETVRKHSTGSEAAGSEEFFKRIMNFKDPKPRTIAKDVKTFPWKILEHALCKVIEKYVGDVPETGGAAPMGLAPPRSAEMGFVPAPAPPPPQQALPSQEQQLGQYPAPQAAELQ